MKAAENKSGKTNALKDNIYMFHCCNKNLKYLPSIIFTFLYIISGIDLIPEAVLGIWIGYFDDVMLLIAVSVYIYCSLKGMIKENDPETEREESIYSHIVCNSGGSTDNTLSGEIYGNTSCDNNSGSDNDVHIDACEREEYCEKPQIDKLIEEIESADGIWEFGETEDNEEKVGETKEETDSKIERTKERSVYASRREEISSEEEMQREFSQESRAECFTIEEDEILW